MSTRTPAAAAPLPFDDAAAPIQRDRDGAAAQQEGGDAQGDRQQPDLVADPGQVRAEASDVALQQLHGPVNTLLPTMPEATDSMIGRAAIKSARPASTTSSVIFSIRPGAPAEPCTACTEICHYQCAPVVTDLKEHVCRPPAGGAKWEAGGAKREAGGAKWEAGAGQGEPERATGSRIEPIGSGSDPGAGATRRAKTRAPPCGHPC
jgi:hypothetical protein